MAIANTDLFLVNRSGTSYKVEAGNFNNDVDNTDLLLVNRGGTSYKVTGEDVKAELTAKIPPTITSASISAPADDPLIGSFVNTTTSGTFDIGPFSPGDLLTFLTVSDGGTGGTGANSRSPYPRGGPGGGGGSSGAVVFRQMPKADYVTEYSRTSHPANKTNTFGGSNLLSSTAGAGGGGSHQNAGGSGGTFNYDYNKNLDEIFPGLSISQGAGGSGGPAQNCGECAGGGGGGAGGVLINFNFGTDLSNNAIAGQLSPYGTVTGTDGPPQPGPSGGRAAIPGGGGTGWGAGGGGGAGGHEGPGYWNGRPGGAGAPGIDILLVSQNPAFTDKQFTLASSTSGTSPVTQRYQVSVIPGHFKKATSNTVTGITSSSFGSNTSYLSVVNGSFESGQTAPQAFTGIVTTATYAEGSANSTLKYEIPVYGEGQWEFHVRLQGTQNQTQISINESGFSGIGVGATTDMFFGYKGFLKTMELKCTDGYKPALYGILKDNSAYNGSVVTKRLTFTDNKGLETFAGLSTIFQDSFTGPGATIVGIDTSNSYMYVVNTYNSTITTNKPVYAATGLTTSTLASDQFRQYLTINGSGVVSGIGVTPTGYTELSGNTITLPTTFNSDPNLDKVLPVGSVIVVDFETQNAISTTRSLGLDKGAENTPGVDK